MALALTCGGCDVAKPDAESAPPRAHVVAMFPHDGCGGDDCTVPTNATITIRFDRFLDPATVNRQAIFVYTGDRALGSPFTFDVIYDPIERVAEFALGASRPYRPNTLYQYELVVPEKPSDFGIRSFDGAPLEEAAVPLRGSFLTSDEPGSTPEPPPAPTCDAIVSDVFRGLGRCAGSECHRRGANQALETMQDLGAAPHSLWLDSAENFALSAIGRVARQTEVGDFSGGVPAVRSPRFGARMALVEPRSPGASYLFYKLLVGSENYEDCPDGAGFELCLLPGPCETSHPALPLPPGECVVPPVEELDRLRQWFVQGSAMPRPDSLGRRGSLTIQGLRAVSRFIAAGADCSE